MDKDREVDRDSCHYRSKTMYKDREVDKDRPKRKIKKTRKKIRKIKRRRNKKTKRSKRNKDIILNQVKAEVLVEVILKIQQENKMKFNKSL